MDCNIMEQKTKSLTRNKVNLKPAKFFKASLRFGDLSFISHAQNSSFVQNFIPLMVYYNL